MNTFLLIRHAETNGNLERRYIGRTDEPIRPEISVKPLSAEIDKLFVSPMLRCRQTAGLFFPKRDFIVIDDLRECDFGNFEGKTAAELAETQEYTDWVNTGCLGDIPGGEGVLRFKERCCRVFLSITETEGESAAIVTHGGVIMSILERFGFPKRGFYEYHTKNAECITRRWKDGFLL